MSIIRPILCFDGVCNPKPVGGKDKDSKEDRDLYEGGDGWVVLLVHQRLPGLVSEEEVDWVTEPQQ